MVQLRRMLGVLDDRQDQNTRAPQPTVAAVPALVAHRDGTSLRVDLRTGGEPCPLSADAEVAAYRIVQEALTNTVKHAGARTATVRLDWRDADLVITVTDDGHGLDGAAAGLRTGGHGLIGIRERARACGGHAETGAAPGGGFEVTARLPYLDQRSPRWPARTSGDALEEPR
jgi:signal transduction histidine kinase